MSARVSPLALVPARSPASPLDPLDDLLRQAAECAGAGIERCTDREGRVSMAVAPACQRCRSETPAVHVRCHTETRSQLASEESHLCPHGQVLRVIASGRLLAIAPARRIAAFHALLERTLALAAAAGDMLEPAPEESGGVLDATVRSLIAAQDARDPGTRGHSERVHLVSIQLGRALGLDAMTRRDLYWASLLHDIGKIGVPDHILTKSGKLTAREQQAIQEHPVRGDEMLGPIRWLAGARRGVRHHHERFDGAGYPDRIAGEEIPLIARIIAVADTFDAVMRQGSSRGERGMDLALAALATAAGTQLDPVVVEALERHAGETESALRAAAIPPDGLAMAAGIRDEGIEEGPERKAA